MNDVVIGVMGGMGPEASAKFYTDFTHRTKVTKDQDHFRLIVDSNSKIPDRSQCVLNAGQSPVAKMLESVELFNFAHVDLTVITCITAHNFIDDIISKSQAKVLNALLLTNEYICEKYSDKRLNIGILATNGSVYSGIFDRYLDFNLIYPGKNSQNMLMDAIYGNSEFNLRGIKGSNSHDISAEKAIIKGVANELIINGANLLLSACTEIPLALTSADVQMNIVNPMDVVIEYIIKNYK